MATEKMLTKGSAWFELGLSWPLWDPILAEPLCDKDGKKFPVFCSMPGYNWSQNQLLKTSYVYGWNTGLPKSPSNSWMGSNLRRYQCALASNLEAHRPCLDRSYGRASNLSKPGYLCLRRQKNYPFWDLSNASTCCSKLYTSVATPKLLNEVPSYDL